MERQRSIQTLPTRSRFAGLPHRPSPLPSTPVQGDAGTGSISSRRLRQSTSAALNPGVYTRRESAEAWREKSGRETSPAPESCWKWRRPCLTRSSKTRPNPNKRRPPRCLCSINSDPAPWPGSALEFCPSASPFRHSGRLSSWSPNSQQKINLRRRDHLSTRQKGRWQMKKLLAILLTLVAGSARVRTGRRCSSSPVPSSGNVTLPLDEYNHLLELASKTGAKNRRAARPLLDQARRPEIPRHQRLSARHSPVAREILHKGATKVPLYSWHGHS